MRGVRIPHCQKGEDPGAGSVQFSVNATKASQWSHFSTNVLIVVNVSSIINALMDNCCTPLFGGVIDDDDAVEMAPVLAALADPVRLRIVSMLAAAPDGSACGCDLEDPLGLSQPTVSHHLKVLREAGLIEGDDQRLQAAFDFRERRRRQRVLAGNNSREVLVSFGLIACLGGQVRMGRLPAQRRLVGQTKRRT